MEGRGPWRGSLPRAAYDAASWESQAKKMAESGATVLAVEDTLAESIQAAADYLKKERGVQSVSLIGASAGRSEETPEEVLKLLGSGVIDQR